MNNKTIQDLINYAAEKHIFTEDIEVKYLNGLLTLDESYNMLARRIIESKV